MQHASRPPLPPPKRQKTSPDSKVENFPRIETLGTISVEPNKVVSSSMFSPMPSNASMKQCSAPQRPGILGRTKSKLSPPLATGGVKPTTVTPSAFTPVNVTSPGSVHSSKPVDVRVTSLRIASPNSINIASALSLLAHSAPFVIQTSM